MSGPPWGNRSRAVHRTVVDLVAAYLASEGIDATTKRTASGLSAAQTEDALRPDLALAGVALNVTSRMTHRFSEDLASAQRTAQLSGAEVGAFCQWRADEEIGNAYVVMSLSGLARLVRGEHIKT